MNQTFRESYAINLNSATSEECECIIPVGGLYTGSVMTELTAGSIGSGVITLYRTNNPQSKAFYALSTPTTITAEGMTEVDVEKFAFLVARVTTAAGAEARVRLTFYGISRA